MTSHKEGKKLTAFYCALLCALRWYICIDTEAHLPTS